MRFAIEIRPTFNKPASLLFPTIAAQISQIVTEGPFGHMLEKRGMGKKRAHLALNGKQNRQKKEKIFSLHVYMSTQGAHQL